MNVQILHSELCQVELKISMWSSMCVCVCYSKSICSGPETGPVANVVSENMTLSVPACCSQVLWRSPKNSLFVMLSATSLTTCSVSSFISPLASSPPPLFEYNLSHCGQAQPIWCETDAEDACGRTITVFPALRWVMWKVVDRVDISNKLRMRGTERAVIRYYGTLFTYMLHFILWLDFQAIQSWIRILDHLFHSISCSF